MRRRLQALGCLAIACLALPSCTADHGNSSTGQTKTGPATSTSSSTASGGSGTAGRMSAGESVLHLTVDGVQRSVLVDRPANGTGRRPLIIFLHGARGAGADVRDRLGLAPDASAAGVVMAYPESDTPSHSWRSGCCNAFAENSEDLDFVQSLINTLVAQGVADPAHVVVGGFSAGAVLANSFGCEHPRSVAAIVSVAGGLLEPPTSVPATGGARHCAPQVPVTVLEIHGTEDTALPVDGSSRGCRSTPCAPGDNGYLAPAQVINGWWRQLDSCGQPVTSASITARMSVAHCAGGTSVGLALVAGAGHNLNQLAEDFGVRGTLLDLALGRGLTTW